MYTSIFIVGICWIVLFSIFSDFSFFYAGLYINFCVRLVPLHVETGM